MDERVLERLRGLNACEAGLEWAAGQPDARTAWAACGEVSDLCWVARRALPAGDLARPLRVARDLLARSMAAAGRRDAAFADVLATLDAMAADPDAVAYERAEAAYARAKREASGFWVAYDVADVALTASAALLHGVVLDRVTFNAWVDLEPVLTSAACRIGIPAADLFREYVSYEEVARGLGLEP